MNSFNSLIYVEKRLIVPIAAKLIGSSLASAVGTSKSGGFSWYIAASMESSSEKSTETRIAELFPEDILIHVYDKIVHSKLTIRELCECISTQKLEPASVVSLIGTLNIPGVKIGTYNPFDPPEITIEKTYKVYGETCFSAEIEKDGFRFPIYFLLDSKEIVCYSNSKPVEVIGVLKWSPSYEVGGFAINQIMLAAALLLLR